MEGLFLKAVKDSASMPVNEMISFLVFIGYLAGVAAYLLLMVASISGYLGTILWLKFADQSK